MVDPLLDGWRTLVDAGMLYSAAQSWSRFLDHALLPRDKSRLCYSHKANLSTICYLSVMVSKQGSYVSYTGMTALEFAANQEDVFKCQCLPSCQLFSILTLWRTLLHCIFSCLQLRGHQEGCLLDPWPAGTSIRIPDADRRC